MVPSFYRTDRVITAKLLLYYNIASVLVKCVFALRFVMVLNSMCHYVRLSQVGLGIFNFKYLFVAIHSTACAHVCKNFFIILQHWCLLMVLWTLQHVLEALQLSLVVLTMSVIPLCQTGGLLREVMMVVLSVI